MAHPFPLRSVQETHQARFNMAEFEPLLDSNEAAALLRIHPKTLQKLARAGVIKGSHATEAFANSRRSDGDELPWPGRQMGAFGPEGVSRFVFRLLLGPGFGAIPAPCGSSLFCFGTAALRVTVSGQILFAKCNEKISPEPP